MKYYHGENRAESSNTYLGYSYSNSQITQYVTIDGEPCEKVSCTCFSYRKHCSSMAEEATKPNHYSDCNDFDRSNRTIKWYRGWSSVAECEQMRQQPNIYMDLTCCSVALCNDQPGKVVNYIKPPEGHVQPLQVNPNYNYDLHHRQQQQQQPVTFSSTLPPPRRHEPYSRRSTTTVTSQQQQQQPQVFYYQTVQRDNLDPTQISPSSASKKLFSLSMQIVTFLFAFLMI